MNRVLATFLAMTLMCSSAALAQEMGKNCDMGKTTSAVAPLKTLKGVVKSEGDKITFVNDEDQKSWDVINPETLKGHEGHHVQLSAHVYADKNQAKL